MNEEILKYAKGMNADKKVMNWLNLNIKESYPQGQVEHIIDYLIDTKQDFKETSYNRVSKRALRWVGNMNKKGNKINEVEGVDFEVVKDFGDGFRFVKLISENSYKREGFCMGHCVASYYGKNDVIYSLRDSNNNPHATLSKTSQQIKGKGNGSINPKYIKYNVDFLKELGIDVRESEMENLGYYNVSEFKKYLNKETVERLFDKKYWFGEDKLIDKNGEEFVDFGLWDKMPLVGGSAKNEVKINFDLDNFNDTAIELLKKKTKRENSGDYAKIGSSGYNAKIGSSGYNAKIGSSGYNAQIGSSGYYAQIGSSGKDAQIGSSGYNAQIGSSGDYAKIGSSGKDAQIGSSGYNAQIGSSGYYAKIGSSGDYAKIGSSGKDAQIGSSGDCAQIGSSGYYAQIGSSGKDAQIGSSGDYAKIGSSGDCAQVGSSGKDAVCSAIGLNSKIKAKKGSWIVLAEYKNNKPVCVKSAKIDGIKLKEDIYYTLKNEKIVEVKNG